jgi:hypothetical protein
VVNGAGGTDTLVMSDAGTFVIPAGVINVEALTLANGTNNVTLNAGGAFKTITGGTGKDTVNLTNLNPGGTVDLGDGDDTLTNATIAIITGTDSVFKGGKGDDTLIFANGQSGNVSLAQVSGFETVNLGTVAAAGVTVTKFTADTAVRTLIGDTTNGNITVKMTAAQLDALTTITIAGGINNFKIQTTDTGAVTVNLADTTYTTLANVNEISFAASTGKVTVTIDELLKVTGGAATNDELIVSGDLGVGANLQIKGVTAFEILTVNAAQTGLTVHNDAVTINANAGGTYTLGTGGDTFNAKAAALIKVTDAGGSDIINQLGTGALKVTLTPDGAPDTIIATGTGAVTVNAGNATGMTTITLNAANGVADTIGYNDGAGGKGLVLSADRLIVNGFTPANDVIQLDIHQTNAPTPANSNAVLQVLNASAVGTGNDITINTNLADVLVLNFDVAGALQVLNGATDGSQLLTNILDGGNNLKVASGNHACYILAYDNGAAYLYAAADTDNDSNLTPNEIALIGVFNGLNPNSLFASNFLMEN